MLTFEDETVQSGMPRMNGALSDRKSADCIRPGLAAAGA